MKELSGSLLLGSIGEVVVESSNDISPKDFVGTVYGVICAFDFIKKVSNLFCDPIVNIAAFDYGKE